MSAEPSVEILELVQRIIQNPQDERALEVLIEKLRGPAMAWIQYKFDFLSEIDADAIFIDAIYRLYTNAKRIRATNDLSVKSFLFAVMKNLVIDWITEMKRNSRWPVDLDNERSDEEENEFPEPWIDNAAEKDVPQQSIEKMLEHQQGLAELRSQLTPMERNVFDDLADGLPQVEIAEKYTITRGRVSQLCKAISKKATRILGEEV